MELHRGQGMEIYWRDNHTCPSEEEYRDMTVRKTGEKLGEGGREGEMSMRVSECGFFPPLLLCIVYQSTIRKPGVQYVVSKEPVSNETIPKEP